MKKIITHLMFFMIMTLAINVQGAYQVEIDEDTYVSDEIYFAPVSTWDEVEAEKVNLTRGKVIFYTDRENEQYQINARVMPINTTNKHLVFKSEDTSVATVDENGVVTATGKVGDTFIDIICSKAKAKLKVRTVRGVNGLTLSQNKLTMYADKVMTAQLSANILPSDATIQNVKWYSEDETIATVDKDGLVSPCGVGETNICAKSDDGGYIAKCVVTVTTWDKRKEDIPVVYEGYDITVREMAEEQMPAKPTIFTSIASDATVEDVLEYVNPDNFSSGYERYQFMDLSMSNDITAESLDDYLNGKGILEGRGSAFKKAADDNGVSEVYLVIHSCLETGNGTSELSVGYDYNGVTVYNMFGIGAVDSSPVASGAEYAYKQGWTSVEKAISGGAKWISVNYINNSKYNQNTLYKMRWNPEKPAEHQYATDIAWASKQAKDMSGMFEAFPNAKYRFEIPRFSE